MAAHIWLSPELAKIQAKTILDALVLSFSTVEAGVRAGFNQPRHLPNATEISATNGVKLN